MQKQIRCTCLSSSRRDKARAHWNHSKKQLSRGCWKVLAWLSDWLPQKINRKVQARLDSAAMEELEAEDRKIEAELAAAEKLHLATSDV